MSIRDVLKKREEKQNSSNDNSNGNLPEGVTRYVQLSSELADGKQFVLLADPDSWFFYYVHEDSAFIGGRTMHQFRKHTCLSSPHKVGEDFSKFEKPNKTACISCAAKARRKLYFMVPVFDPQYNEWRVLDLKEYHAMKLIADYDKLEKAAQKFQKGYTLVGDAITIAKTSDGKSYTMSSGELDEAIIEAAKALDLTTIDYGDLAYFREEDDIRKLLADATAEAKLDKSVLGGGTSAADATPSEDDGNPADISGEDLPF